MDDHIDLIRSQFLISALFIMTFFTSMKFSSDFFLTVIQNDQIFKPDHSFLRILHSVPENQEYFPESFILLISFNACQPEPSF
jgi:hypothetical protein